VPARMGGFMMGAYFVASGVAQYLGGIVASFASVPETITDPVQMMPIYTRLFNWLGVAGVACTIIALAVLPLIRGLDKAHATGITYAELPEAGKGMPTAGSER